MFVLRLVVSRVLLSLLTLLLVSIIIFAMLEVLPGDVASRIWAATQRPRASRRCGQLHLDQPAPQRYLDWLGGILRGDFGKALTSSRLVTEILAPRIFNTLVLSAAAFVLYLPLALVPAVTRPCGGRARSTTVCR